MEHLHNTGSSSPEGYEVPKEIEPLVPTNTMSDQELDHELIAMLIDCVHNKATEARQRPPSQEPWSCNPLSIDPPQMLSVPDCPRDISETIDVGTDDFLDHTYLDNVLGPLETNPVAIDDNYTNILGEGRVLCLEEKRNVLHIGTDVTLLSERNNNMSTSNDSSSSWNPSALSCYKEAIEQPHRAFLHSQHDLNNNIMLSSDGGEEGSGCGTSAPSSSSSLQQKHSLTSSSCLRDEAEQQHFLTVNVPLSASERDAREAQQIMGQQMKRHREYFDSQQQGTQLPQQGVLPWLESQGTIRSLPVLEHHGGVRFNNLFPSPDSALGIIPRSGQQGTAADQHSLDYQLQHRVGGPRVRPYLVEASAYPSPSLDCKTPWNLGELTAIESDQASYGGPLLRHQAALVYGQRSFQSPPHGSESQQLALNVFDVIRRHARLRHKARARGWIPLSQLTYDASGSAESLVVAPPRQLARRGEVPTAPILSRRQAEAAKAREDVKPAPRKRTRTYHSPSAGENRLRITFTSLGALGEAPQHFGTKGHIIPDGLSGSHQVYHQRWRFDIQHQKIEGTICVSWSITNLTSTTTCQRTETPREARLRNTFGHTICNQLLRQALETRATELEIQLPTFLVDNPTRYSSTEALIKALRPNSCILGLLFFGLLHDGVQQRMRYLLEQKPTLPAPVSTSSSSGTTGVEEPALAEGRETSPAQEQESTETASSASASDDANGVSVYHRDKS